MGGLLRLAVMLCLIATLLAPLSTLASAGEAPIHGTGYSMTGDASHMRLALNLDREPNIRWFLLRSPHRLVIDLPDTRLTFDPKDLKSRDLIKAVRYGAVANGVSRLVITGKGPFLVDRLDVLKNEDGSGYRLAADIKAASEREFADALSVQAQDDRIDRFNRQGRARPARRQTSAIASPSSSTPAMAASTGGRKAPTGRSRRTLRSLSPPSCATSSSRPAAMTCS